MFLYLSLVQKNIQQGRVDDPQLKLSVKTIECIFVKTLKKFKHKDTKINMNITVKKIYIYWNN